MCTAYSDLVNADCRVVLCVCTIFTHCVSPQSSVLYTQLCTSSSQCFWLHIEIQTCVVSGNCVYILCKSSVSYTLATAIASYNNICRPLCSQLADIPECVT